MSDASANMNPRRARLDQLCDAFESAWKAKSDTPDIIDFLNQAVAEDRSALIVELLLLDRHYRQSRSCQLDCAQYESLLPEYQTEIRRLFNDPSKEHVTYDHATRGFDDITLRSDPAKHSTTGLGEGRRVRYFGDYEIVSEIARGGMGVVYRARQISLNRLIALKMILSGQLADPDLIQRFKLEAEAAANLDHPGIVPIYDIGEFEGQHYFSMKLIEGRTLSQVGAEFSKAQHRAVELVAKVADAIHHAHQRGILHRDLKPGNILVDANGEPLVTDFGLARNIQGDQGLTQTGAILGTPGFMSPEQAGGEPVTTATDIYSLGAILYQLLCGRPPHQGDTVMQTLLSVVNDPPAVPSSLNPTISPDLELILLKCLAKEPNQRYSSAAAFAADLRSQLTGEPISVRTPSLFELTRLWLGRNYGKVMWVPIIAIVIGVLCGSTMWISTFGQDMSLKVASYANFPESERPWLVRDWTSLQLVAVIVFLLTVCTMGWATAKLVSTKNRAADIGAGLSVGLLAGLIAFVSGLGAVLLESMRVAEQIDSELIFQLAVVDDRSYTQDRLVTHYPTLENFEPKQRAWLLRQKTLGDQWSTAVAGIAVGAFLGLVFFGLTGLLQTYVAGPLIRNRSLKSGMASYACFSIALVLLYFVLAGPSSMYFLIGSAAVFNWYWPGLLICVAILVITSVARDWPRLIQFAATALLCTTFVLSIVYEGKNAPPQVAQHQTEIRKARQLYQSMPNRRDFALRLVRAHDEYGKLLVRLGRNKLATQEFKQALELLETGRQAETFNSQERIIYAGLLYDAGLNAQRERNLEEALQHFAKHTRYFRSSYEVLDAFAQSVVQLGLPGSSYIQPVSAPDAEAWRRAAAQLRAIAKQKATEIKDSKSWLNDTSSQLLESAEQVQLVSDWPARKQQLSRWLASQQRWELFGPIQPQHSIDVEDGLLKADSPEDGVDASDDTGTTAIVADKTIECYVGSKIDLIEQLGRHQNVVAYARTRFKTSEPQMLRLRLGSDDGITVWLDGELLLESTNNRMIFEGDDEVSLQQPLAAGEHTMVLKITQGSGDWAFVVDAATVDGWPLPLWNMEHE